MLARGSHNQSLVHTLMAPSAVSLPRPLLVLCIQLPVGCPPANAQSASRLTMYKPACANFSQNRHSSFQAVMSSLAHLLKSSRTPVSQAYQSPSLQILTVRYYPCFPCSPFLLLLLYLGSHCSWPELLNSALVASVCFLASLSSFCLPLFPLLPQAIICQWSK